MSPQNRKLSLDGQIQKLDDLLDGTGVFLRHDFSGLCADSCWQGDFEPCHSVTLTLVAIKFLAWLLSSHMPVSTSNV